MEFDFNADDEKIIKAIPKKGTFDISDLSGRTLYSPSRVNKTVQKLLNKGYLIKRIAASDMVYLLSDYGEKIKLMIDRHLDCSGNTY